MSHFKGWYICLGETWRSSSSCHSLVNRYFIQNDSRYFRHSNRAQILYQALAAIFFLGGGGGGLDLKHFFFLFLKKWKFHFKLRDAKKCREASLNKDVDFKQDRQPSPVCVHSCTNMEEPQEEKTVSRRCEEASRWENKSRGGETNVNNKAGDRGKSKHTEIAQIQEMKSWRRPRGRGLGARWACPGRHVLFKRG